MKTGIELIAEERQKQTAQKGWTAEHDDHHTEGELVDAAMSYARHNRSKHGTQLLFDGVPLYWPFEREAWRPADKLRNLVKAGALLAAEIDRLQRHAESAPQL